MLDPQAPVVLQDHQVNQSFWGRTREERMEEETLTKDQPHLVNQVPLAPVGSQGHLEGEDLLALLAWKDWLVPLEREALQDQ